MSANPSPPQSEPLKVFPERSDRLVVTLTMEGSHRDIQRSHDALIRFIEQEETVRDDEFSISADWHDTAASASPPTPDSAPPNVVKNATDSGPVLQYGIEKCRGHWHVTSCGETLIGSYDTPEEAQRVADQNNAGDHSEPRGISSEDAANLARSFSSPLQSGALSSPAPDEICACGHTKDSHVPFSPAGANGFYGCLACQPDTRCTSYRALQSGAGSVGEEPSWPCRNCGVMRRKAEGGNIFTYCDECWEARSRSPLVSVEGPTRRRLEGEERTTVLAEWAQRFACYAFTIDGYDSLTEEQQQVCRDAAEWAMQRVDQLGGGLPIPLPDNPPRSPDSPDIRGLLDEFKRCEEWLAVEAEKGNLPAAQLWRTKADAVCASIESAFSVLRGEVERLRRTRDDIELAEENESLRSELARRLRGQTND